MAGRRALTVSGEVHVPGDKSVSHRALILAALASGESHIHSLLKSDDVESTARVLRALGATVPALSDDLTMQGSGTAGLRAASSDLYCGNSGTTARLMMGVAAALPFASTFSGDASLSRRPMRRVATPLTAMGARVELAGGHDGLPLTVHGGSLHEVEWQMEKASAQVKSALLLAGYCAGVRVVVREPAPTRDHTERMLLAQGVECRRVDGTIELVPGGRLEPLSMEVPGDASTAAYFAALGALADRGELRIPAVGLNPGRTGFLTVLRRMGADVAVNELPDRGPEPLGDVVVKPRALSATTVSADEVPSMIDELPMLACLAARAEGETVIRGAEELRVKESDRIAGVVANLRAIGAEADELPDGMRIRGSRRPFAGTIRAFGDHRLAMAFGILGATAHAEIHVDDPACVAVSYPNFWRELARVTG